MSRYIQNTTESSTEEINSYNTDILKQILQEKLTEKLNFQKSNYPYKLDYSLQSDGSKEKDPTIYAGSGGNIYLWWRMHCMYLSINKKELADKAFKKALKCLEINNQILEKASNYLKSTLNNPSFFCGASGVYALGAILFKINGSADITNNYFLKFLNFQSIALDPSSDDEIIYGRAGYLYSLLLLKKNGFQTDELIKLVVEMLFKSAEIVEGVLTYCFPKSSQKNKKTIYYGAAHGITGIVYLILKAMAVIPSLKEKQEYLQLVDKTCKFFLSRQFPSGNFPCSMNDSKDTLVHFCHGASGLIPFFLEAHKFWNDKEYLLAAIKCGNCVWERGILLKGNCICHGIGGSCYFLYRLYTITKDLKWLFRTGKMIEYTWDPKVMEMVDKYSDPTRMIPNKPDHPYSLMEGSGGEICLFADFISDNMYFPGFEI